MNQEKAFEILHEGHNVFLTGPAGAGKTYLLNQFIAEQREKGNRVAVTASTGIAATHMNGKTIHSWSGMPFQRFSQKENRMIETRDIKPDYIRKFIMTKKWLMDPILNTQVLIIDEVSMMHDFQLDMLDKILQVARDSKEIFGGVQVILCGDFFQLPPVSRTNEGKFIYDSKAWKKADLKICYLTTQFRQNDAEFLYLLNSIREGTFKTDRKAQALVELSESKNDGMLKLFTHNEDIDRENITQLIKLEGEEHRFEMTSSGNAMLAEKLKKWAELVPQTLKLKVGAPVMFLRNKPEEGYVNGTLGKVKGFTSKGNPVITTTDGKEIAVGKETWSIRDEVQFWDPDATLAEIHQIPIRLAWSTSIHKSQGMSLDAAEINLANAFVEGQGYVAMSRVRSLAGLRLTGVSKKAFHVNQEVLAKDQELRRLAGEHATTQKTLI